MLWLFPQVVAHLARPLYAFCTYVHRTLYFLSRHRNGAIVIGYCIRAMGRRCFSSCCLLILALFEDTVHQFHAVLTTGRALGTRNWNAFHFHGCCLRM